MSGVKKEMKIFYLIMIFFIESSIIICAFFFAREFHILLRVIFTGLLAGFGVWIVMKVFKPYLK